MPFFKVKGGTKFQCISTTYIIIIPAANKYIPMVVRRGCLFVRVSFLHMRLQTIIMLAFLPSAVTFPENDINMQPFSRQLLCVHSSVISKSFGWFTHLKPTLLAEILPSLCLPNCRRQYQFEFLNTHNDGTSPYSKQCVIEDAGHLQRMYLLSIHPDFFPKSLHRNYTTHCFTEHSS